MKSVISVIVAAVAIIGAAAVLADSSYFDCQCFYGKTTTNSNPNCNCDCAGATLVDGQQAIGDNCAYGQYGVVRLSVVSNATNTTQFSGSSLELSLQGVHGLTGNATALRYVRLDDADRALVNYFSPRIVSIFAASNGTIANEIIRYAKTDSLYEEYYKPLGILEVEVFFRQTGPTSGLVDDNMSLIWIILPIVVIFIAIIECCCASSLKPRIKGKTA